MTSGFYWDGEHPPLPVKWLAQASLQHQESRARAGYALAETPIVSF